MPVIRFTTPFALLWLLILPFIILVGWPSQSYNRRRETASLILRVLIFLFLILSLAGIEISNIGQDPPLAVVFILDVSESMPANAISSALDFIHQSVDTMDSRDQFGLIVFGQDALVEYPLSTRPDIGFITSIPKTYRTNLAQAVHLGLALYPPTSAKRMVILSDGAINDGRTDEALQIAVSSGVDVQVRPILSETGSEVIVRSIDAPHQLRSGDQFDLEVTIESSQPVSAQIQVFAGSNLVYEGNEALKRGLQSFSLPLTAQEQGFTDYQVRIIPNQDTFYQNNSLSTYTRISGPPKVLIVAPPSGEAFVDSVRPDEYTPILNVLKASGFLVESVSPVLMPSELPILAQYASIILIDVPARQLTTNQMIGVQTYVRDLGGGLVVVGGPTSYGVGGYFRTPLEETLPVEMQLKDEQRRPSLAMIFIIDHSGSMSETSGGPSKLDLAKEAVIRSTELLNPNDQVGVVIFDDAASWVVPVGTLEDGSEVRRKVASIGIGGGTDILAGIQAVAKVASSIEAGAKHVILLTDGGADPTGIPELVQTLNVQQAVTLSAIGVGEDAAPYLAQLAEIGGGRYHFAADPSSIPNIYTEETTLATRAYIIEDTFTPAVRTVSPILDSIEAMPVLYGYIGTTAKETAQTILVSHENDPVLASWRYGLGKAVAFTSDASGRWAKEWLNWNGFSIFWSQVVRYTVGDNQQTGLDIKITMEGSKAVLSVEAVASGAPINDTGYYLNHYKISANIVPPDDPTITLNLQQVAPGLYQAEFLPTDEGVYLIRLTGEPTIGNGSSIAETTGWAFDYSPEYGQLNANPDQLVRTTLQAGGEIADLNPAAVFSNDIPAPEVYRPLWPVLLALAAFILPFDVGIRRVALSKYDLRRAQSKARSFFIRSADQQQAGTRRTETMDSLLKAKLSAREQFNQAGNASDEQSRRERSSEGYPAGYKEQTSPETQTLPQSFEAENSQGSNLPSQTETFQEKEQTQSSIQELLAHKRARRSQEDRER